MIIDLMEGVKVAHTNAAPPRVLRTFFVVLSGLRHCLNHELLNLVEVSGFEPLTFSLRTRRSTN